MENGEKEELICNVCYENENMGELVKIGCCGAFFHKACLKKVRLFLNDVVCKCHSNTR